MRQYSRRMRSVLYFFIAGGLVFVYFWWKISWSTFRLPAGLENKKIILAWTKFFGTSMQKNDYLWTCREVNCVVTDDRRYLSDASAVVFHVREDDFSLNDLPKSRSSNQSFVFLSHESPLASQEFVKRNLLKLPNFFNWTMTYRLDSDIPYPYKYLRREKRDISFPKIDWTPVWKQKKSIPIVWLNSNCNTYSKRELYANQLKKYINMDIYGQCGALTCDKSNFEKCNNMIAQYFFYFAFENAICKDYISEKLWARYSIVSVPIVLKRSIYKKAYPDSAYIAIDDFKSPQKLAEYLKYLQANQTAYMQYFNWREQGYYFDEGEGFCRLCAELNKEHTPKSYKNLLDWWMDGSACDNNLVQSLIK